MTMTQAWSEEMVEVAGINLQMVKGGSGESLLILHDEMGHPGWLPSKSSRLGTKSGLRTSRNQSGARDVGSGQKYCDRIRGHASETH